MLKVGFCCLISCNLDLNFKLETGIKLLEQIKEKTLTPIVINIKGLMTRKSGTPADLSVTSS